MRRIPIRFTRFGTYYVLFSLGVGAAAINTGNNLLYLMLGLLLGFIIISGFLSDSCLWGVRVELQPLGDFYVDQKAEWEVIAHKNWFPGVLLEMKAAWKTLGEAECFYYWIARYGKQSQRIAVTPSKRGALQLEKIHFATRFPFGLFEKSHSYPRHDQWVVFPKVRPLSIAQLQAGGLQISDQPAARRGLGATPFDLREFKSGDSSKRIHWKSSAKHGQWMVSEMEEESALSQNIFISHWPEDIESFISFVASLLHTLHHQGLRVALKSPGASFAQDRSNLHLKKMLTYLALVDPADEPNSSSPAPSASWTDAVRLWKGYAV